MSKNPFITDDASLRAAMAERARATAAAEDAADAAGERAARDARGAALPLTLPGPRAPRHEDHPAYGVPHWPPRAGVARDAAAAAPPPAWARDEGAPSWARGDDAEPPSSNRGACSAS